MREEDYANVPDEVMEEYFAARDRRRGIGSCSSCAHSGCCDDYCGGSCWTEDAEEGGAE